MVFTIGSVHLGLFVAYFHFSLILINNMILYTGRSVYCFKDINALFCCIGYLFRQQIIVELLEKIELYNHW